MPDRLPSSFTYSLLLGNGLKWNITDQDGSAGVVSLWAQIMSLNIISDAPGACGGGRLIKILVDDIVIPHMAFQVFDGRTSLCVVPRRLSKTNTDIWLGLTTLSDVFMLDASSQGVTFLHAALVEYQDKGVLLAGSGGVGKTTATLRLPGEWIPLSDDTTVLVDDEHGCFRAHPWPTWSQFFRNETHGCWDVQHFVPLKAIFFIEKSEKDYVGIVGQGEGLGMLVESSRQVVDVATRYIHQGRKRLLNSLRFNRLVEIASRVPVYKLGISLHGRYWELIENILDGKDFSQRL